MSDAFLAHVEQALLSAVSNLVDSLPGVLSTDGAATLKAGLALIAAPSITTGLPVLLDLIKLVEALSTRASTAETALSTAQAA